MSAVYILAYPGPGFLPFGEAIRLLGEKSAVFADYKLRSRISPPQSGAGMRLRLATSEAGMSAHDEPVRRHRKPDSMSATGASGGHSASAAITIAMGTKIYRVWRLAPRR
jgi:hypothetical protein